MLKVLLVDDEPFIVQGLSALIDWEKEGFEIVGTAGNGSEAVEFLKSNPVDLILADIKMPVMNGLEFLKYIRETHLSEAFFVILSGYGDFTYAKEAIKWQCTDYILKPIQKSQLLALLSKVKQMQQDKKEESERIRKIGKAYFVQQMQTLLLGRQEETALSYVKGQVDFGRGIRYIGIESEDGETDTDIGPEKKRQLQRQIYEACMQYLGGEYSSLTFLDAEGKEECYDVGFIFCKKISQEKGLREQEYINLLLEKIQKSTVHPVVMYVGSEVEDISDISESFRSAVIAKTFSNFKVMPNLLYYSKEQKNPSGIVVSHKKIEDLLRSVEENDKKRIEDNVAAIYEEMNEAGMNPELVQMNMNYLLYRLVSLAMEQDDSVNQDEVLQYICENAFQVHMIRGSLSHFRRFVMEYADYLVQLRQNASRGVLLDVEGEIRKNYAENLTLKELGKKYFVNSAYLGQMFRKKYGVSFKEYLNNYRIERAAEILLRTDDKIYLVAEEVGYRDLDYFINRFIQSKGCTPTTYRKKTRSVNE